MITSDYAKTARWSYKSALRMQPVGRDGFVQLLRAELTKFRTVRAWVITLGLVGALIIVFAWLVASSGSASSAGPNSTPQSSTSNPRAPVGPAGEPVVDTFSFLHQPLVGNGSLTAKVTSLTEVIASGKGFRPGLVPWAKAGIIIKANTTQGSAYAAVMVTPSHGVRMQYNYTHDVAGLPGAVTAASPRWLRLTRAGDLITAYDSIDGTHWAKIGAVLLTGLPDSVQTGLFVTSPASLGNFTVTVATGTLGRVLLVGDFPNRSWSGLVVGANTQTYPTEPIGGNLFQQSAGTFTISGSGDIAPQVAGGLLGGMLATVSLFSGGTFGLVPVIVLATLFITSEYRRGLLRTTFTASPRRGRLLVAKAVVIGSVTFVASCIGTAIAEGVSRHPFPLSAPTELRTVLGTGILFALAAIFVLALGTMFRRSAGAIVIGIALFVLPLILWHSLSSGASDWLFRLTPAAAFAVQGTLPRFAQVANAYTIGNGYYPLGPWAGIAVLCGYAAVALGAAMWSIRRRDV